MPFFFLFPTPWEPYTSKIKVINLWAIYIFSFWRASSTNTTQLFPTESKYILRGFVAERKGERFDMQDAHFICDDFLEEFDTKATGM